MKAGTAAALKADYERKTVAGRVPYLQIHETNEAAELHDAFDVGPCWKGLTQWPVFPRLGCQWDSPGHGRAIGRLFGNGIGPVIGGPSSPADARVFGARLRIASAASW